MKSSDINLLIFRKPTRKRSIPFDFLCEKTGLAYLLNGRVVVFHICVKSLFLP